MKSRNVRIGIIGCGWIAENAHIPAFSMQRNVTVSSVFDIDILRAQRLAKLFNIPGAYDNLDEFLCSDIDAVIIATPNATHVQYSLQALKHGMHVLCEKPVAIHSNEVKQIIDTAEEKHSLFIPCFVNRFRFDILKMRELVQSDRIGDIIGIEAGWLRRAGIPRPGTWFTNRAYAGGGVLIDLGSHIIDICLMILGDRMPLKLSLAASRQYEDVENANALWFETNYTGEYHIDVEDTVDAQIYFEGDVFLKLKLNWAAQISGDYTYFIIHGTRGRINLQTLFGFSNDRLWKDDSLVLEDDKYNIEKITLDKNINNTRKAFYDMASYFTDAIKGKRTKYLVGTDALKTVELIEGLYNYEKETAKKTMEY
jgi:predicted dehydrogenase